jgi:ferritin-like protein
MHDDPHNNRTPLQEPTEPLSAHSTRKGFLKGAALAGVGAAGLGAFGPATALALRGDKLAKRDIAILGAAQIAEALAVTTYTNIINTSPFFQNIPDDDQDYLKGAVQEEMSHYLLEESLTNAPTPFTQFFYPEKMFTDPQTTLNTLVTLEDAFIAAYLIGVREFSDPDLKVTAARIMGIESDHRTLARVVAGDVSEQDGGPLTQTTGLQGVAESISPPNNNGYERTLGLKVIAEAVDALLPFADKASAEKAGFDATKSFQFVPFTPTLPTPLGEFHSFTG